jgi:hypothetical protein
MKRNLRSKVCAVVAICIVASALWTSTAPATCLTPCPGGIPTPIQKISNLAEVTEYPTLLIVIAILTSVVP